MRLRTFCSLLLCCVALPGNSVARAGGNPDYLNSVQQGWADYRAGHYRAAEGSFVAALNELKPDHYRERAETLAVLGNVYAKEDALPKAEQVYAESLSIYKQIGDKKQVSLLLRNISAVYSMEGRAEDALEVAQQALRLIKANRDTTDEVEVLNVIGIVYYRQGKNKNAEKWLIQAVEAAPLAKDPVDLAELWNNLGNVYQAEQKYEKAEPLLKQALAGVEARVGPAHPELNFTLASLGRLYAATGRYAEAEAQYQRALSILQSNPSNFETRIAILLHELSATYGKVGRKSDADATLAQAATIARSNLSRNVEMGKILEDYSESLKNHGQSNEAEQLLAEVRMARTAASLVTPAHEKF
jgi:tetratricopeptide (TPR) repeat protein